MGLCDCCGKTFCLDELSDYRQLLFQRKLIDSLTDVDTRFCPTCVEHINGLDHWEEL